jgi:type IV pilus assembly protein PilO
MRDQDKRLSYVGIAASILLVASGLYGYFGILSPLHQKVETVSSEIKQQQTFFKKIDKPSDESTSVLNENTFSLQEEVPVKPLVYQLILQLEKAEVLSDSSILTMDFSDSNVRNASDEGTDDPLKKAGEILLDEMNLSDKKESSTLEDLPEGIQKVTVEMSVVSKNYEGLLKFLSTIEELKRITVIEAITFSGLDEIELASTDANPDQLKYEVTVAAFYLPELTEYLKDLPREEFPAPQGKENPLIGGDEEE